MNKKMLVKSLVGLVLAAAVIPMFLYGGMAVQILVLAAIMTNLEDPTTEEENEEQMQFIINWKKEHDKKDK